MNLRLTLVVLCCVILAAGCARTLWRRRAWAFASAWIAVVAVGAVFVMVSTSRINATTDLRALQAVLAQAPAPLFSFDLQDLALSFNLGRPVVNDKNYQRFEDRARQGEMEYLIISDRALRGQPGNSCIHRIARGSVTRQLTVLGPTECSKQVAGPDHRRSG